jgi:hypothetical protein
MEPAITAVMDNIATTSLTFVGDLVTGYWGYFLGFIAIYAIAWRVKRMLGAAT